jgi:hypothetical protein
VKSNFQGGASVPASRDNPLPKAARGDARPTEFILPLLAAMILFFASVATAETTKTLSDAEIQGRKLARQLCDARPAENFTNIGILKIRDGKGETSEIPIKFEAIVTETNWTSIYEKMLPTNETGFSKLIVMHDGSNSNEYRMTMSFAGKPELHYTKDRSDFVATLSFAGDFSVADLGLGFFHWPEQKILKREFRRNCGCAVLESTNPNLSSNNAFPPIPYSRVVSWIDEESGGIVHAEAFDAQNKLLKEFDPKSFKKVNGQWELQEMEIRNVQTGSRTRLEFDLNKQ